MSFPGKEEVDGSRLSGSGSGLAKVAQAFRPAAGHPRSELFDHLQILAAAAVCGPRDDVVAVGEVERLGVKDGLRRNRITSSTSWQSGDASIGGGPLPKTDAQAFIFCRSGDLD